MMNKDQKMIRVTCSLPADMLKDIDFYRGDKNHHDMSRSEFIRSAIYIKIKVLKLAKNSAD